MLASAVRRAMSQRSAYVSVSLSGPGRGARDLIEAPGLAFQGEEASGSVRRDACAAATTAAAGYVMRCAPQSRERLSRSQLHDQVGWRIGVQKKVWLREPSHVRCSMPGSLLPEDAARWSGMLQAQTLGRPAGSTFNGSVWLQPERPNFSDAALASSVASAASLPT